jgi:hypothetical protein
VCTQSGLRVDVVASITGALLQLLVSVPPGACGAEESSSSPVQGFLVREMMLLENRPYALAVTIFSTVPQ